jgi:hypothetical protein
MRKKNKEGNGENRTYFALAIRTCQVRNQVMRVLTLANRWKCVSGFITGSLNPWGKRTTELWKGSSRLTLSSNRDHQTDRNLGDGAVLCGYRVGTIRRIEMGEKQPAPPTNI